MKPNGPVFTLRVAIVKLLFCVMVRVITAVSVRLRVRVRKSRGYGWDMVSFRVRNST